MVCQHFSPLPCHYECDAMSEGSRLPSGRCGSLQDTRTWLSAPAVDEITLSEVIGASSRLGLRCKMYNTTEGQKLK